MEKIDVEAEAFNVGYMKFNPQVEDIFLSVTPGFEHGPGIQRDGISAPRMTDPHCVPYVMNAHKLKRRGNPVTTVDSYQQRAGTWTLYQHLKNFVGLMGEEWRIVAVQGHGDLTMNYWHVAYCNQPGLNRHAVFCHLGTIEDGHAKEPFQNRTYRCLIKWKDPSRSPAIEFATVSFEAWASPAGVKVSLLLPDDRDRDITDEISLAMAGKTIIENRIELPLETIIDRFDDVRHVFALPKTPAQGYLHSQIDSAILGEYNLYKNLNERRAALHCPVVIPLQPDSGRGNLEFKWDAVQNTLAKNHFRTTRHTSDIPTLRGQFRQYPGQSGPSESVEVFFPRNVYPFGVVGMRSGPESDGKTDAELICLASGGLSGRIGNTLEGITRIAYDFLACGEAMVVDEGLDVFQLINPPANPPDDLSPKYSNQQLLASVAAHTVKLQAEEQKDYAKKFPGEALKDLPLNEGLILPGSFAAMPASSPSPQEIFPVIQQRSQIRSVLIFAKREKAPPE